MNLKDYFLFFPTIVVQYPQFWLLSFIRNGCSSLFYSNSIRSVGQLTTGPEFFFLPFCLGYTSVKTIDQQSIQIHLNGRAFTIIANHILPKIVTMRLAIEPKPNSMQTVHFYVCPFSYQFELNIINVSHGPENPLIQYF